MKKKIYHSQCTIRRTKKITHSTINMATGKKTPGKVEVVTEKCGTPLFGALENETGVCLSCVKGWEVKDNKFANADEKVRATGKDVSQKCTKHKHFSRKCPNCLRTIGVPTPDPSHQFRDFESDQPMKCAACLVSVVSMDSEKKCNVTP